MIYSNIFDAYIYQMWMSVATALSTIVILMPHAPTLMEALPAHVMMAMQEMVSPVKVCVVITCLLDFAL